ncbi:putative toxin-antitoxin system toxin component, PIN family [Thiorhodovibrio winogradskyi]|uniref:Toxin-antitoxin system toxin component, PIN family n=1 Tax=Thiorhodovibrio winogradskyi TaxID=77007 RepID=A0ABZ0SCY5_9GAMM|nr:putative toxin-antitoxin system toxin component, PIN family [Thiorhodovibrio winogradskyi]
MHEDHESHNQMPARIVLDTNVLYAGLFSKVGKSHQLLKALWGGKVRLVLSTPLLFEYEEILKRNQNTLNLADPEVDIILDQLCAMADYQQVYFLWRPCLPDPKDDMVLELAVAAQGAQIVTFNIRDFSPAEKFGI